MAPLLLQLLLCSIHFMTGVLARGSVGGGGGRGGSGSRGGGGGCVGAACDQDDQFNNSKLAFILVPILLAVFCVPLCALVCCKAMQNERETLNDQKSDPYTNKRAQAKRRVLESGGAAGGRNGGEDVDWGGGDGSSSSRLRLPEKAVYLATMMKRVYELHLSFRKDDGSGGEGAGDVCNFTGTLRIPFTNKAVYYIVDGRVSLASRQAFWVQNPVGTTGADKESFVVGTWSVTHHFTGQWTSKGSQTGPYSFKPRRRKTPTTIRKPPSIRNPPAASAPLPDHDETTSQTATTVSHSTNADNFAAV